MKMKSLIFSLFFLVLLNGIISVTTPNIEVYFESLCGGCEDFIGASFKRFYNTQGHENLAKISFYPYGNANEQKQGSKWTWSCQHGEEECLGNLVETCAMNKMDDEHFKGFLICLKENNEKFSFNFNKTAAFCEKDPVLLKAVMDCTTSDEGNALQHEVAVKTDALQPSHQWVPWVIVDGVHDSATETLILDDLLNYLCKRSGRDTSHIEVCKNLVFEDKTYNTKLSVCLNYNQGLKFLGLENNEQ